MTPAQLQPFNFYLPDSSQIANRYGIFQVSVSGSNYSLTYAPGGPCSAGSGDGTQTIPVDVAADGSSFSTGYTLTVGQNSYAGISASWNSQGNFWSGTLGTDANFTTLGSLAFPAGGYLFMVYDASASGSSQVNALGGQMALDTNANVSLTIGANNGRGACGWTSSLLRLGHAPSTVTITVGGVTYTFPKLFGGITPTAGRIVLAGSQLTISSQANQSYRWVALPWPACNLPTPTGGWQVYQNGGNQSQGQLPLSVIQAANPGFSFTLGGITYTGMPQLSVVNMNSSSGPSELNWNFGGTFPALKATDGEWSSQGESGPV